MDHDEEKYDADINAVGLAWGNVGNTRREARRAAQQRVAQQIEREVSEAVIPAENALAVALREAYDRGVPMSVIRKYVFFGNHATWSKYRDWADIPKGAK